MHPDDEKLIPFPGGEEEAPAPPAPAEEERPKALLLGLDTGAFDAERSMAELSALAQANGLDPVAEVLQKRSAPVAATVLGQGRLAEAKLTAENLEVDTIIFDGELKGSQIRNLEAALKRPVLDRTLLILQIFKQRAVSREGKTQTELATLEYRLPRLAGLGSSLSRQGGGGGGGGGARRGGGETQLEYDRRYIRSRIAMLKRRLADMEKRREETRRSRQKNGAPVVALVGYTNVGKSSLLNALAGSSAGVADMLFATLDPTARSLSLPDGQHVVLVDTVGFVSRLPHQLVEAFKSTLEEAAYADLLLEVADAADGEAAEQLRVTSEVLHSLHAAAPRLTVYNKCDLAPGFVPPEPGALAVSAATGEGLDDLLGAISGALAERVCRLRVLLPYDQLPLADVLRRFGHVETEDFREDGVFLAGTVEVAKSHLFAPYLVGDEKSPP